MNSLDYSINHAIDFGYIVLAVLVIAGYRWSRSASTVMSALYLPLAGLLFIYLLTGELFILAIYAAYVLLCWALYRIQVRYRSSKQGIANALLILVASLLILYKWIYPEMTRLEPMTWVPVLGISYLSFRALDFAVELRRDRIEPAVSLADIAAYLMFFPTLAQGPIMRFLPFQQALKTPLEKLSPQQLAKDGERLCIGVIKILFLGKLFYYCSPFNADMAAVVVDDAVLALLSLYATYLFIYIEFSGISDVAIVFSRWAGFTAPENFNRPLLARNPQEFWARWHMSFTRWCQDHIYFNLQVRMIRLAPQASSQLLAIVPILTTFTVIGLWHGFSWHWLYYGLVHAFAVYLVVLARSTGFDSWLSDLGGTGWNSVLTVSGRVLTFNFVSLSLVFALPQATGAQLLALLV